MKKNKILLALLTTVIVLGTTAVIYAGVNDWKWFANKPANTPIEEYDEEQWENGAWLQYQKIVAHYKQPLLIKGTIQFASNDEKSKEEPFEFAATKNNYFYKIGNTEVALKDSILLLLLHDEQSILLQSLGNKKQKKETLIYNNSFLNIEKERITGITLNNSNKENYTLSIFTSLSSMAHILVSYNPQTYIISKVVISNNEIEGIGEFNDEIAEEKLVEIVMEDSTGSSEPLKGIIKTNTVEVKYLSEEPVVPAFFAHEKYYTKNKEGYTPAANYQTYQFTIR